MREPWLACAQKRTATELRPSSQPWTWAVSLCQLDRCTISTSICLLPVPAAQGAFLRALRLGLLLGAYYGLLATQPGLAGTAGTAVEVVLRLLGAPAGLSRTSGHGSLQGKGQSMACSVPMAKRRHGRKSLCRLIQPGPSSLPCMACPCRLRAALCRSAAPPEVGGPGYGRAFPQGAAPGAHAAGAQAGGCAAAWASTRAGPCTLVLTRRAGTGVALLSRQALLKSPHHGQVPLPRSCSCWRSASPPTCPPRGTGTPRPAQREPAWSCLPAPTPLPPRC